MQIPGKLFYNSKGLTEQNAQDKIVFMFLRLIGMLSAMNEDNLSCAFYSYNLVNKLLPSVAGQRDTPMDKRAILWTKETSPL